MKRYSLAILVKWVIRGRVASGRFKALDSGDLKGCVWRRGLDTPLLMLSCCFMGITRSYLKIQGGWRYPISFKGNLAVNSIILEDFTLCVLNIPPLSVVFLLM